MLPYGGRIVQDGILRRRYCNITIGGSVNLTVALVAAFNGRVDSFV